MECGAGRFYQELTSMIPSAIMQSRDMPNAWHFPSDFYGSFLRSAWQCSDLRAFDVSSILHNGYHKDMGVILPKLPIIKNPPRIRAQNLESVVNKNPYIHWFQTLRTFKGIKVIDKFACCDCCTAYTRLKCALNCIHNVNVHQATWAKFAKRFDCVHPQALRGWSDGKLGWQASRDARGVEPVILKMSIIVFTPHGVLKISREDWRASRVGGK